MPSAGLSWSVLVLSIIAKVFDRNMQQGVTIHSTTNMPYELLFCITHKHTNKQTNLYIVVLQLV